MGRAARGLTGSALLLGALWAWLPAPAAAAPEVVASIKPVHSLVSGVMRGVGEPDLLVKAAGSEHSYSLRPSQARALEQAEVVFLVGETMETFLLKPLQALAGDARIIELSEVPGLILLATREGGMWQAHGDEHAGPDAEHDGERAGERQEEGSARETDRSEREPGEEHAQGEADMHIWLDPRNARAITAAIATALADADPGNAALYQANAEQLRHRLDELDRSLEDRLSTVGDRPYVVFHDAYQYFENRYGVEAVGAITINPTVRPSAQRLQEIRGRLEQLNAACVFAEPQFEPTLVETVTEGTSAKAGVLDPLGADLEAGPEQYFQLMSGLAASLVDCLGQAQ